MDLASLKQLPMLANRPNFPQGLCVLLLDPDYRSRAEAEALLKECAYTVAACSSSAEAAARLSNPDHAVDVLLFDVKCLQQKTAENSTLTAAAKLLPLVLMSETSDPSEVMLSIKLGAVDFMEKPLSPLKLKNIWQHTVRRLMGGAPVQQNNLHMMKKGAHPAQLQHLAAPGPQQMQTQQQQQMQQATQPSQLPQFLPPFPGHGPASHPLLYAYSPADSSGASHGSGGESGSNASTLDRANVKADIDMDIEASSLADVMLLGSHEALANLLGGVPCGPSTSLGGPTTTADLLMMDHMECDAPATSNTSSKQQRPPRKTAMRQSNPGMSSGNSNGHGGAAAGPKPALGYPAGQMPALPADQPGMEWGLPTNPLQIMPSAKGPGGMAGPMAGLMGAMGPMGAMAGMNPMNMNMGPWPMPGMNGMNPMSAMGMNPMAMPNGMFPPFMFNPAAAAAAAASGMGGGAVCGNGGAPSNGTGAPGGAMSGMHTVQSTGSLLPTPAASSLANTPHHSASQISCQMKRAESAPPSLVNFNPHGVSVGGSSGNVDAHGFLVPSHPSMARAPTAAPDFLSNMDSGKGACPPIGLQLKKSPSLVDFISQSLKQGNGSPAS